MCWKKHSVSTWRILESFSGKFKLLNIFNSILARFLIQDVANVTIQFEDHNLQKIKTANTLKLFIYHKCDIMSSLAEALFKHNGCMSVCIIFVLILCNGVISDSAEECYF